MIPRDVIQKILEAGAQAPSGENAQPWRFVMRGESVLLMNIPERDRSLYNFEGRASYIAHGAVIENIIIAAAQAGFPASAELFPDKADPNLFAKITFADGTPINQELYSSIEKRTTNRKAYDRTPLSPELISALEGAVKNSEGVQAVFIADPEKTKAIAEASSTNDQLLLENRSLHDFFFEHVHWTLEEEERKRMGFYIKVLELMPPVEGLFKVFKYWPIMNILNKLGFAKKGAKENTKIYAASGAIGALVISSETPETFINVGRALERIWLTATDKGVALQPLTGVLFFHQRLQMGDDTTFSAAHQALINDAYVRIASALGVSDGTIAMMFRLGHADPPTAHSLKLPPDITFA